LNPPEAVYSQLPGKYSMGTVPIRGKNYNAQPRIAFHPVQNCVRRKANAAALTAAVRTRNHDWEEIT
jgi:hypothetical protein